MPPVLLLVLALLVEARTDLSQAPSMPLTALWTALRDQLAGSRDLPANQDDLLNTLGLPTTAAVLLRAAEGQPVQSTDAFRNMYASVFLVTRANGVFVVSHQWDHPKREALVAAVEATEAMQQQQQPPTKGKRPGPPPNGTRATSSAMTDDDPEGEMSRKRKRVPDSALGDIGERSTKSSRLGVLYPEDEHIVLAPAAAPAARPAMQPGTVYSLDAGAAMGGATAFVRGGIVTELSLLAPKPQARPQPQAPPPSRFNSLDDAFAAAIRQSREVSTHATYTVATKRISSGRGFDMLQRMNWRAGQGLGKRQQGRVDPLEVKFRADRTGL